MPSEVQPATVAEVLGTVPATPQPAPLPDRSAQPAAPVAGSADVDAKGTPFDPERHLPRPHPKTGVWMPRRRPAGAAAPAPAAAPASTPPPAADPAPDLSDIARAAAGGAAAPGAAVGPVENATLETCIGLVQMLFILAGEEEGLLTDTEKLLLRQFGARILAKYSIGSDSIPCEVEGVLLLVSMFIERVKRGKKTATFFAKAKAWFASVFFRARGAAVGAQMRREAPLDLVAALQREIEELKAKVPVAAPQGVVP